MYVITKEERAQLRKKIEVRFMFLVIRKEFSSTLKAEFGMFILT